MTVERLIIVSDAQLRTVEFDRDSLFGLTAALVRVCVEENVEAASLLNDALAELDELAAAVVVHSSIGPESHVDAIEDDDDDKPQRD